MPAPTHTKPPSRPCICPPAPLRLLTGHLVAIPPDVEHCHIIRPPPHPPAKGTGAAPFASMTVSSAHELASPVTSLLVMACVRVSVSGAGVVVVALVTVEVVTRSGGPAIIEEAGAGA